MKGDEKITKTKTTKQASVNGLKDQIENKEN